MPGQMMQLEVTWMGVSVNKNAELQVKNIAFVDNFKFVKFYLRILGNLSLRRPWIGGSVLTALRLSLRW